MDGILLNVRSWWICLSVTPGQTVYQFNKLLATNILWKQVLKGQAKLYRLYKSPVLATDSNEGKIRYSCTQKEGGLYSIHSIDITVHCTVMSTICICRKPVWVYTVQCIQCTPKLLFYVAKESSSSPQVEPRLRRPGGGQLTPCPTAGRQGP